MGGLEGPEKPTQQQKADRSNEKGNIRDKRITKKIR
jgi:hypothetical protein